MGAFSYAGSVNWENAERLKSNLLNEAILMTDSHYTELKVLLEKLKN